MNRSILKVTFHQLLSQAQLRDFLKVDDFRIVFSCSQGPSLHTMFLKFENENDAFHSLFKNGTHDFRIEMFSIFNHSYSPSIFSQIIVGALPTQINLSSQISLDTSNARMLLNGFETLAFTSSLRTKTLSFLTLDNLLMFIS